MKRMMFCFAVMVFTASIAYAETVAKVCDPAGDYSAPQCTGINLSELISNTYPITRKCPPINGEKAVQLMQDTPAKVYFKTKGWKEGYLVKGDTVYYDPDTLSMTRMVRCGNPARGKVKLPPPKVVHKTRIEKEVEYIPCPQPPPPPPTPLVAPTPNVTVVTYNNTYTSSPVPGGQTGGFSGGMMNSTSLFGMSVIPQQQMQVCITNKVVSNNSNAITVVNANNNLLNGGGGTVTGNATGNGSTVAGSGN